MARIVFATMGSWGDLFPMIALARGAAARGHDAALAATPAYRDLVEAEEVRFLAAGPRFGPREFAADPAILDGRQGGFAGFLHLSRTVVFPNLERWVQELRRALAGADLAVAHPALLALPVAAELERVSWLTFSVFPGLVPSASTLPSRRGCRCRTARPAARCGGGA